MGYRAGKLALMDLALVRISASTTVSFPVLIPVDEERIEGALFACVQLVTAEDARGKRKVRLSPGAYVLQKIRKPQIISSNQRAVATSVDSGGSLT